MQIATVVAIIVVAVGVFFNHRTSVNNRQEIENETEVVNEVKSESSDYEYEDEITPSKTDDKTVNQSPTQVPTQTDQPSSSLDDFVYPGASVTMKTQNSLSLSSHDDAKVITDWYKTKIDGLDMSVNSFVVTQANDKVSNSLVASDGEREIDVSITKESSGSPVIIKIQLTSL